MSNTEIKPLLILPNLITDATAGYRGIQMKIEEFTEWNAPLDPIAYQLNDWLEVYAFLIVIDIE